MKKFDAYFYHRKYFEKCRAASPLNRLLYLDFKTFMPALNLDTTDKTSMAANLEVRAPFLNKELVELSARIPASLKIKGIKAQIYFEKSRRTDFAEGNNLAQKSRIFRARSLVAARCITTDGRRFALGRNDKAARTF